MIILAVTSQWAQGGFLGYVLYYCVPKYILLIMYAVVW
jgi:hypothetical protein